MRLSCVFNKAGEMLTCTQINVWTVLIILFCMFLFGLLFVFILRTAKLFKLFYDHGFDDANKRNKY